MGARSRGFRSREPLTRKITAAFEEMIQSMVTNEIGFGSVYITRDMLLTDAAGRQLCQLDHSKLSACSARTRFQPRHVTRAFTTCQTCACRPVVWLTAPYGSRKTT